MRAAPSLRASNGFCLYMVPTWLRWSSSRTGRLMAPGIWSRANSAGERTSMISENSVRSDGNDMVLRCCILAEVLLWLILFEMTSIKMIIS